MANKRRNDPQPGLTDRALTGISNLIKLLPTGTVFVFQFLNPVLTNNGHCAVINKYLSGILIGLCGLSCAFSCFTDSYTTSDGFIHYGVATFKGMWPKAETGIDLSSYKIRVGDFVHALFSILVFAVVSLLDPNTVQCFYPMFGESQKVLLMVLPTVIGAISSTLFVTFPNKRHGIGYTYSSSSAPSQNGVHNAIEESSLVARSTLMD